MMTELFTLLVALHLLTRSPITVPKTQVLAEQTLSLNDRYPSSPSVNTVMKENILLTLAYMDKPGLTPKEASQASQSPMQFTVTLRPGEVFAFHDAILPKYEGKVVGTTNAHFASSEGFKSDGYLFGDGVCHLASLMSQVAQRAGLVVDAPTPHDFATIPDIPKQFGVSIYSSPANRSGSAAQNLYITNPYKQDIQLVVESKNSKVNIRVAKRTG